MIEHAPVAFPYNDYVQSANTLFHFMSKSEHLEWILKNRAIAPRRYHIRICNDTFNLSYCYSFDIRNIPPFAKAEFEKAMETAFEEGRPVEITGVSAINTQKFIMLIAVQRSSAILLI